MDELDTSTAFADLQERVIDRELVIPAKSALGKILRGSNGLLFIRLLIFLFAIFTGLIRSRGNLVLLYVVTGRIIIQVWDDYFTLLIFLFGLRIWAWLLINWHLRRINLALFFFFLLLFSLNLSFFPSFFSLFSFYLLIGIREMTTETARTIATAITVVVIWSGFRWFNTWFLSLFLFLIFMFVVDIWEVWYLHGFQAPFIWLTKYFIFLTVIRDIGAILLHLLEFVPQNVTGSELGVLLSLIKYFLHLLRDRAGRHVEILAAVVFWQLQWAGVGRDIVDLVRVDVVEVRKIQVPLILFARNVIVFVRKILHSNNVLGVSRGTAILINADDNPAIHWALTLLDNP